MKPCSCRHVTYLETEKLIVYRKIVFGIVTGRIEHNVLELNFSLGFETLSTEILLTMILCLLDICKAK